MRITKTRIVKVDGEYRVKAYGENGKRYPAADYFTTDRADAEGTARLMVNPAQRCPYCGQPTEYDQGATNGIRPTAGKGCEFCDPTN